MLNDMHIPKESFWVVVSGAEPLADVFVRAGANHGIHFAVTEDPALAIGTVAAIVIRADAVWFTAVETAGRLAEQVALPVLLWVHEPSVACRVAGYERGVADVCAQNIDPIEFAVRLRGAVLRATRRVHPSTVSLPTPRGPLVLTPARLEAKGPDGPIKLTALQWRLLSFLLAHRGIAQSHGAVIRAVWGRSDDRSDRHTLRTHVSALRRVLGIDANVLRSVHGYGYVLSEATDT